MKLWVKYPGPGQMRGEGEWIEVNPQTFRAGEYEYYRDVMSLPTHEGNDPPEDQPGTPSGTGSR